MPNVMQRFRSKSMKETLHLPGELNLYVLSTPKSDQNKHFPRFHWFKKCGKGHFTVVGLMTLPSIGSEAGGDLVFIQTSLLFTCRSCCSYAN